MKYFKFNYLLTTIFLIIFGLILWKFFGILSFTDSYLKFEGKTKKEKLYSNETIIQKIIATENNLNQINISVSRFSPKLGDKIVMEILDQFCQKIIAESKINKFTWSSPNYERFRFKSITDSKNKTYCLRLSYVPSENEQEKKAYISSYSAEGTSYINTGELIGEQKNRTLKLKPAYDNGHIWKNFSQLIERISQYKPDFLKNYYLIFIFFLSLTLILALVFTVISI